MNNNIPEFVSFEISEYFNKQKDYSRFLCEIKNGLNEEAILKVNKNVPDQSVIEEFEDLNEIISALNKDNTYLAQEEGISTPSTINKNYYINNYKEMVDKIFLPSPILDSFVEIEEKLKSVTVDSSEYLYTIGSISNTPVESTTNKRTISDSKFINKKRKRENNIIPSKELIKYYHQLQNQPQKLTKLISQNNFNQSKYSKRNRFPTLNHVFGERIIYNYKHGKLIDSYASVTASDAMHNHFRNFITTKANEIKLKVENKLKCKNKSTKVTIKPLGHKLIKNRNLKAVIKVIKSDMKNNLMIDEKLFNNLKEGDKFEVGKNGYYSIKNYSQVNELILQISYV